MNAWLRDDAGGAEVGGAVAEAELGEDLVGVLAERGRTRAELGRAFAPKRIG